MLHQTQGETIPKIAIVGAGPGGCMLARLLHVQNVPCTIFEGETSIDYRSQGGTLDLRAKTGLAAIQAAGLWDEFLKYARYDGESLLITDKYLNTWMRRYPSKPDQRKKFVEAPEIDRSDLRKLLMENIPEANIQWGKKLARVQDTDSGPELHFVNGEVERGYTLIVGCDGAFSKTRVLLTSEEPFYTGLSGWILEIPDSKNTAPIIHKLVNSGSVFAFSDGKNMAIQQLSSGAVRVSTYYQQAEQSGRRSDQTDLASVQKMLSADFGDWAPELQEAFNKAQGKVERIPLYMLPVGFTWPHKEGVTLLGDAAHLMVPFSGIGVNTAFYDALLLSRQIAAFVERGTSGDFDKYIASYEQEMFEHAHKAQAHSEGSMNDMLLTPGAPRTSIEVYILRHAKEDLPRWTHPILTAIVYFGYWVYKLFV
ncbi:hypothetical protein GQ44DRAFT_702811 [Phaeosphaeriaceae sp. PMI808]|nr:hypothetical protein GQ44DRAFT_702811 [Phaeosphaeriaceae sp. PMI808]